MNVDDDVYQKAVAGVIARLRDRPGPLVAILRAIQDELGYVSAAAVPLVARELDLSRAEVYGTISFYHDLRCLPPARHVIRICRAESCHAMNNAALIETVRNQLGIDFHKQTEDGNFALEPVYCLGDCACSPAAMIDGVIYGRLTPQRLEELLNQVGAEE